MTVRRITVQGVAYCEGTMIPLLDSEGEWYVLCDDGVSFFRDSDEVRTFAQEMADDPDFPDDEAETIAAYRELAALMDELDPAPTDIKPEVPS